MGIRVLDGIEELIGNTPIIGLHRMFPGYSIYAKLEYYNPTFSVKDRAAFYMVKKMIERGEIKSGDTIIEATSGNTGLGLCMASIIFGLHFIATVFDDVSEDKIKLLQSLGATVIICPSELPSNEIGGYVWLAQALAAEYPHIHYINQFSNPDNPEAHIFSTGPEIWNALNGKIDLFVNTVGTGGTISGVSHFLKKKNPNIQTIAVEPVGGIYRDFFYGNPIKFKDHLIHSISDNFISKNFNKELIDDVVQVCDSEAFSCCIEMMRTEALCIGTSAGCTIGAIKKLIQEKVILHQTHVVCTLADSALKYSDSLLNETFWEEHRFSRPGKLTGDENVYLQKFFQKSGISKEVQICN